LSFYHPELIKTDSNSKSRLEEGIKVGDLARKNFLEGVYIESTNHLEALELTKTAIHKRLTIFEAAFLVDNVLIRTDLLIPEKDSYRLVEVKSSTSIKNYHLDDAAIQAWVMGKAGISPTKTSLAHINNEFVYQGDGDYGGLFSEVDISEKIENAISKVEGWVEDSKLILSSETEPQITPGDQCFTPFTCEFLDYCRPLEVGVEFPVEILPNSKVMAAKLRQQGYKDLRDVPETLLRNPRHLKVRAATISGQSILDLRATSLLKNLSYPRYYLDFETIAL
jgi:hypothetical protein